MNTDLYVQRKILLICISLISFPLLTSRSLAIAGANLVVSLKAPRRFDPTRYLPRGARIKNRSSELFVDLDGDGKREVVIFYTMGNKPNDHKASVLVLKATDTDYVPIWEDVYEGSWGFADPTGVYDLNKTGTPQIIVYRTVGTSCPGSLEIYEYRGERIQRMTGDWGYKGHCEAVEIKRFDGDRIARIKISHGHGAPNDVYAWNGKRYGLVSNRPLK